jgi:hypothetical protein
LYSVYAFIGYEKLIALHIKQTIMVVSYTFLWLYMLILLYTILVEYYKQNDLKRLFLWIIKLHAIVGVLSILNSIATVYALIGIMIALSIGLLIMYILIFNKFNKIDISEVPDAGSLHSFVTGVLVAILAIFALGFYIHFGEKPELKFLNELVFAFPFVFLIRFMLKVRSRIYTSDPMHS